jgi:hypothetical protein
VHRFCEAREIPCLLPNIDTPPEAGADFYSTYFSAGTRLEARAIAAHLARRPSPERVLQVFRARGPGSCAAAEFASSMGHEVAELSLPGTGPLVPAAIVQSARDRGATTLVLWLDRDDLAALGTPPLAVYVSSTLLGGDPLAARTLAGTGGFIAHPYALPREVESRSFRVSGWLRDQGIPLAAGRERRIQDQTFFTLTVLNEVVMHLRKNFYRDYMLEVMDHFSGLDSWSAFYPQLSFGPGQRHLSKGCSLLTLDGSVSEWVVP